MIVPEFWAEARIQKRFPDRQVTVRRFGWSDVSVEDAQQHAEDRVAQAFDQIINGAELPRREQKVRYNGSDGLPIREEIVERLGDSVVTRNSYGAKCLNTPNVFFADVDFPNPEVSCSLAFAAFALGIGVAIPIGFLTSRLIAIFSAAIVTILLPTVVVSIRQLLLRFRGGSEAVAFQRIEAFSQSHPDWHLRVYRTPNGFRVLALHELFDPRSEEVEHAFQELKVDQTYQLMCQKQNCFRARLTAKPWRIGIRQHLKPRPGVWPVDPSRIPERNRWLDEYDSSAANFASCQFVTDLGATHQRNRTAQAVCDYHDRLCQTMSRLPIA